MSLGEAWFYHLERSSLETVLPELLEKTLARGWRALVRGAGREGLQRLDRLLWTWRDDSFLAHGLEDEPWPERQPILLGLDGVNRNGAQALFLVDDAEADDISAFERCVVIFDGRNDEAVASARALWSRYRGAGIAVAYWREHETRGWARVEA